jgi:hypothetical protein
MAGLPDLLAIAAERDAIRDGRLLLDDPDKIKPLVDRAADVLRSSLNQTFAAYQSEYGHCTDEINSAQEWARLAPEDRAAILRDVELATPEKTPKLGTLADLVDSLTTCSPYRWGEKTRRLAGPAHARPQSGIQETGNQRPAGDDATPHPAHGSRPGHLDG